VGNRNKKIGKDGAGERDRITIKIAWIDGEGTSQFSVEKKSRGKGHQKSLKEHCTRKKPKGCLTASFTGVKNVEGKRSRRGMGEHHAATAMRKRRGTQRTKKGTIRTKKG